MRLKSPPIELLHDMVEARLAIPGQWKHVSCVFWGANRGVQPGKRGRFESKYLRL